MITFIIGLVILIVGGTLYGALCEKVFAPDDRKTPAYTKADNVDYVPMKRWKNSLVNLLNIAGTGPILGPVQGILFGPIAFLTIPIGCIIGGAVHDYYSGMISTRLGGIQMPEMVKRHSGKTISTIFSFFIFITCLLCVAVFVYTPGDITATQVFGFSGTPQEPSTWIIYGVIFAYYLVATILPIDKIIGKIYPLFGCLLLVSSVGIAIMLVVKRAPLCEIWGSWELGGFSFREYFTSQHFIPTFFITVACGIMSGFHSSQTALVSRTLQSEKHGRMAFYNMMLLEGFIAMVWAAATMAVIGLGADNAGITMKLTNEGWEYFENIHGTLQQVSPTSVVGVVCKYMLGNAGGLIAILGIIILPVSSGDTALRSLRLMVAEALHLDQKKIRNRFIIAIPLCAAILGMIIWAKIDANGFNTIWRYFGWANQTCSVFVTSAVMIYFIRNGKAKFAWIPAIPFAFYFFISTTYLMQSRIGFRMNITAAYIAGGIITALALAGTVYLGIRKPGRLRS